MIVPDVTGEKPGPSEAVPIYRKLGADEVERALLGALLLEPIEAWPLVSDILERDHFTRNDHKIIFQTYSDIADATGNPPDVPILLSRLESNNRLTEAGGREYIVDVYAACASAANVRQYAIRLREINDRLAWLRASAEIAGAAREGSAEEAAALAADALDHFSESGALVRATQPIETERVSDWADRTPPPARDWIVDGLIPAGRVTALYGNGGLGKTLLAMQLGLHVSIGRSLFDIEVSGGPVLGIFCEDEQDELERRGRSACFGQRIELRDVDDFYPVSRDGHENLLCTFEHDQMKLTKFYHELEATIDRIAPRLVILDTAADFFAGDFISTTHVRQFIKSALGGLCVRHGCAIVLIAHPSQSAMASGDGGGFSVAWSNSVRSRLYLRRPKSKDKEAIQDRRVLQVMKANYGTDGLEIPLLWQDGYLVLDPEPIDEAAQSEQAPSAPSRLSFSVLEVMRANGSVSVVSFKEVFEALIKRGQVSKSDKPETSRKKVQRALDQLVRMELVKRCTVPRGTYRLVNSDAENLSRDMGHG